MIFPQKLHSPEEHTEVLAFFQKLLRDESSCRLEEEYPLVFRPEFCDRLYVKRVNEKPIAGLAALEREIEVESGRIGRFIFVGSVVTDPAARLQGFQRELFHALEEEAEKSGADGIVLWSSQISFYEKLGFFLGGLQATWTATHRRPFSIDSKQNVVVSSSSETDLDQSHFLIHERRVCAVKRSFEEMQLLWKIPSMTIARTENAYALMGKGEDFQNVIHEWGGRAEDVLSCFDRLREIDPQVRILSPGVVHSEDESRVVQELERASFECRLEYLGLFKPISKLFNKAALDPSQLKFPFFIWGLDSI